MKVPFVTAAALLCVAGAAVGQNIGPSTTTAPYVLPTAPGVSTTSIFTVGTGDVTPNGYRMVGIPDGLGAFSNGDGTFTLMMNHELGATSGIARAHGQTGAFVSRWNISTNLTVNSGRDHNTSSADAYEYTGAGTWSNAPSVAQRWGRFCSADLAAPSAYYNAATGLGTQSRIFMNGEEIGAEGRAYAHIISGSATNQTWQLPSLGKFSWENSVANPFSQNKTVVMGTDDSTPGQVYMYIGQKQATGNDIEKAGLTNGSLYGVRVAGAATEPRATGVSGRFDLFSHGSVSERTGASLQTESVANGVTEFLRPEDGAWDTRAGKENDFYFVTTDRYNQPGQQGRSRLYRMRFDDITNPTAGGEITPLFSTEQGPQMMDNICIDSQGRILIQEDIGNNAALGKIWLFDTNTNGLIQIAVHDSARFISGNPGFLTQDEESSGIIDAKDILGDGWFLLDVQAHYGISGELVEGGQLLALYVDPSIPAPGAAALLGLGGLVASRRRRA
jgi:MYXO-CTERM domain-containing protein